MIGSLATEPIVKAKYKIYSTVHLRQVTLELLLISEIELMLRFVASIAASRLLYADIPVILLFPFLHFIVFHDCILVKFYGKSLGVDRVYVRAIVNVDLIVNS